MTYLSLEAVDDSRVVLETARIDEFEAIRSILVSVATDIEIALLEHWCLSILHHLQVYLTIATLTYC